MAGAFFQTLESTVAEGYGGQEKNGRLSKHWENNRLSNGFRQISILKIL